MPDDEHRTELARGLLAPPCHVSTTVLDEAEHDETIVITRSGRRIAVITPAPHANGEALREVFRRWSSRAGIDETFAADVAAAREAASAEWDTDPWHD